MQGRRCEQLAKRSLVTETTGGRQHSADDTEWSLAGDSQDCGKSEDLEGSMGGNGSAAASYRVDSCAGSYDVLVSSHPIERANSSSCRLASDGQDSDNLQDDDLDMPSLSEDEQFSDVGEPGSTQVVYVREGIAMWPTKQVRIMGRLSLVKQHCVMFLAWLPYSAGSLNADGTFQLPSDAARATSARPPGPHDRSMYAVHPMPLSEVKSIQKQAPSFGWQYIIIVLNNGLTIPPLYFSTGGVKAFFSALKQHVLMVKSANNPSIYLINDVADPLQRSLTTLALSDIQLGGPPPASSITFAPTSAAWAAQMDGLSSASPSPLVAQVLDGVQRFSIFARDATQSLFGTASFMGPAFSDDGRPTAALGLSSSGRAAAFSGEQSFRDSKGGRSNGSNCEGEARTLVGVFELLDKAGLDMVTKAQDAPQPPPLSVEEWATFFNEEGRCVDERGLRRRVFDSGIEQSLRKEAWKFLLGVYDFNSTAQQRVALRRSKKIEYRKIKAQWMSISDRQARMDSKWRDRRSRIDKDICRTDRSHPFFASDTNVSVLGKILRSYCKWNVDLGYCQGMSDLLSPLIYVMRDEAEAFWCFTELMDGDMGMGANFHTDSTAMHAQLGALRSLMQLVDPPLHAHMARHNCLNYFFCYRWLLIHFKREFGFDDVLRLWEVLWSRHVSPHFHIYLCAAVLGMHRRAILESDFDFDGMLRFCIQLSGKLDLAHTMRYASSLAAVAGEEGHHVLEEALAAGGSPGDL